MSEIIDILTHAGGCIVVVRQGEIYLEPNGDQAAEEAQAGRPRRQG